MEELPESEDWSTTSTETGASDSGSGDCGYLDGPCCQTYDPNSAFGGLGFYYYCNDGLECRGDVCVTGPTYEAYDRSTHSY